MSTGLTSTEAARRLAAEGANSLPTSSKSGLLRVLFSVATEPMLLLLIGAAAVYLLLGSLRDALILGASLVAVVAITVVQERKTERALEALRDLSSPRALVIRDSEERRIAGIDVVRGDLLVLAEGDRVPADALLEYAIDFMVDESLLTGESVPVGKSVGAPGRDAQVFSGTLIVKGHAKAVVSATGAHAELGRIGASLAELSPERTGLQRETARMVKIIAVSGILACVLLGLYYAATRGDLLGGILGGLTLAMSILPEEFPVVLTVFLAIGAWRISRDRVLTRRMPAIEMLGAATVLCVDKTGTLTENRMAVAEAYDGSSWRKFDACRGAPYQALFASAAFASELRPFDPMDRAILEAAQAVDPSIQDKRSEWQLIKDYPFGGDFLAMCHAWRSPGRECEVFIKGAPESVLPRCRLDRSDLDRAHAEADSAAARGLRLLAVARCSWPGDAEMPEDPGQYPFRWLGFVALADPIRASVPDAIAQCKRAGVRVVMITGDHAVTAAAIARQAGIPNEGDILTGAQIAAMSDAELSDAVRRAQVYARILPEQKLRLIAAYKASGEVVAMTGDGVNDAPALKAAHIGIAMGRRGTDVAREAAALVLLDDDFGSIVATIRLGRRIYENIRNAMAYLLGVHVQIAGMAFVPVLFGGPLFLFPVHVVFLEFVIDPACSIVFEAERSEEGAMRRPPRPTNESLFSRRMVARSLLLGVIALITTATGYALMLHTGHPIGEARAFGFAAMVFANLAMILANRSRDRAALTMLTSPNRALWAVIVAAVAALGAAIYIPSFAEVFGFEALGLVEALGALAAGVLGVLGYDAAKLMRG